MNALREKIFFVTLFTVATIVIWYVYINPATVYEQSIYRGEGSLVLVFVASGIVGCLWVLFANPTKRSTTLSTAGLLVLFSMLVFLPILRGYYYHGIADAMTHLGWTVELLRGDIGSTEILDGRLLYPVIHILGATITVITGAPANWSLLFLASYFVIFYFSSVALLGRILVPRTRFFDGYPVFVSAGLLVLPVNLISVHTTPHATSQSLMYASFVLFVFVLFLLRADVRYFLVLIWSLVALLLLHPQQFINFLMLMGTVTLVIHGTVSDRRFLEHRHTIAIVIGGLFLWIWISGRDAFESSLARIITSLITSTADSTDIVQSRTASIEAVGGSLPEIFVKLFAVSLVFCLLTAAYWLYTSYMMSKCKSIHPTSRMVYGIATSLLPIGVIFFVYLIALGDRTMYFRHLGFIMLVVTVVGAYTLVLIINQAEIQPVVKVVLILFIVVSLLVVFPSPYIYQGTPHVTEGQVQGYESIFEYQAADTYFYETRIRVYRFADVVNGPHSMAHEEYVGPNHRTVDRSIDPNFTNHSFEREIADSAYLTVTNTDYELETSLYRELLFTEDDFNYLENKPKSNKMFDNHHLRIYKINM